MSIKGTAGLKEFKLETMQFSNVLYVILNKKHLLIVKSPCTMFISEYIDNFVLESGCDRVVPSLSGHDEVVTQFLLFSAIQHHLGTQ